MFPFQIPKGKVQMGQPKNLPSSDAFHFFDQLPEMVCELSSDGCIQKANQLWGKKWGPLLGISDPSSPTYEQELLEKNILDYLTPQSKKQLEGCLQTPGRHTLVCVFDLEGEEKRVSVSLATTSVEGTLRTYAICRAYQNEQQLRATVEQQEVIIEHQNRLASIGELSAGMGHEINNPLAIILSNILRMERELTRDEVDNGKLYHALRKQKMAAWRIKNIVDGLKGLAHQKGKQEKTDLRLSAKQTLGLVEELYATRNILIRFETEEEPLFFEGDPNQIQQVLLNLLNNARDAMLSAKTSNPVIDLKLIGSTEKISIQVKDNGPGMTSEVLGKIFHNFFTTKPRGEGTGMGLAISKTIIEKKGGKLSCQSEPGKGTTFLITLPRLNVKADPKVKTSEETKKMKALVVDDDDGVREVLAEMLKDLSIEVVTARQGKEGLQKLDQSSFDIIFTDLNMPVMNGERFLQAIKDLNLNPEPVLIAVAGGISLSSSENKALGSLIDNFISKPFDEEQLKPILEQTRAKNEPEWFSKKTA